MTNAIDVTITPLMVKKILKSLPKSNAYVKMAALAETMQELAVVNTHENCIDTARATCHEFIDKIFDKEEDDCGF